MGLKQASPRKKGELGLAEFEAIVGHMVSSGGC
jgi:hypothetical protein